jgi:hypothetical protein
MRVRGRLDALVNSLRLEVGRSKAMGILANAV